MFDPTNPTADLDADPNHPEGKRDDETWEEFDLKHYNRFRMECRDKASEKIHFIRCRDAHYNAQCRKEVKKRRVSE